MDTDARETEAVKEDGFLAGLDRIEDGSETIRGLLLALPSWITPNRVTVFRGLLIAPATALLVAGSYWWALALLMAAAALDALDGALARARNERTDFGAFTDPLMDKLLICVPLLTLALVGPLNTLAGWTVAATVSIVEAALVAVRIFKMRSGQKDKDGKADIGARNIGKHKMRVQSLALTVIIVGLALGWSGVVTVGVYLMGIALLLGVASLVSHLPRR